MSSHLNADNAPTEEFAEDPAPRELESALLSLILFGSLVAFGVGCILIGWN